MYIFLRVNHNFSPSIWNSLALVCFIKKLKLQFWYFLKKNLGQMKNSKLISKSFDTLTYTIWLFHLKMKGCFTLRILFISTAAIYLMLVRISSIQVSLSLIPLLVVDRVCKKRQLLIKVTRSYQVKFCLPKPEFCHYN